MDSIKPILIVTVSLAKNENLEVDFLLVGFSLLVLYRSLRLKNPVLSLLLWPKKSLKDFVLTLESFCGLFSLTAVLILAPHFVQNLQAFISFDPH